MKNICQALVKFLHKKVTFEASVMKFNYVTMNLDVIKLVTLRMHSPTPCVNCHQSKLKTFHFEIHFHYEAKLNIVFDDILLLRKETQKPWTCKLRFSILFRWKIRCWRINVGEEIENIE